jgi:hypothetical protein
VTGRWLAFNSPADRVPSHHLHAYGQTYAIDLVHDPADARRPGLAWWPLARRPADFPGFGQPVLAPADATVVRAHDAERDHWSRTSPPAMLYLVAEGMVRELLGPGRILGNHVVLDLGDGVYAALAHLRRGSVRVRPGDRVAAGQQLAACGNSGNSTEPHLHFQLMDHPSVLLAAGLPVAFDHLQVAGGRSGRPARQPGGVHGRFPANRLTRARAVAATSRQPLSMVRVCPRPFTSVISLTHFFTSRRGKTAQYA